jgi:hypothetical protein
MEEMNEGPKSDSFADDTDSDSKDADTKLQ